MITEEVLKDIFKPSNLKWRTAITKVENEAKMLESVLVSFCDHGVTPPSTQSARLMASAGSPMHSCLAGGLLAFGKNHAGAIERSMQVLQEGINSTRSDMDIDSMAEIVVEYFMKLEEKIPGFGHRYHDEDPRAPRMMELAHENECRGRHSELGLAIENLLFESKGIRMNIVFHIKF